MLVTRSALRHLPLLFLQHKVLLQQFNTGDERAQKRQPIRGSDEGEQSVWNFIVRLTSVPGCHHLEITTTTKKKKKKAQLLALGCAPRSPDKLCS